MQECIDCKKRFGRGIKLMPNNTNCKDIGIYDRCYNCEVKHKIDWIAFMNELKIKGIRKC